MRRLHRDVVDVLLPRIAERAWKEGAMLPKEVDLKDELGVSRGVVREALGALEGLGVLSITHGRGATVLPASGWHVLDPVVARTVLRSRGGRVLRAEIAESRLLLEPAAAGLAAQRAGKDEVRALGAALEAMRGRDGSALLEAEQEFHLAVVAASGNRALSETLRPAIALHADIARRRRAAPEDGCRRVVDEIVRGDAEGARAALRAHLERALPAPARRSH